MSVAQCRQHLAAESIGRVGVTAHALPVIIPVNYVLDEDDTIVFRTAPDGQLARACDDAVVAFEIDRLSPDGSGGWSVLVIGVAHLVSTSADLAALSRPPGFGAGHDQLVSIASARISGRQVGLHPVSSEVTGRAS